MLLTTFEALGPLVAELCDISGNAGLSYGVLHEGVVVHQGTIGYRDVDKQLQSDSSTIYSIASLTKAFTAALVGILVDDGKLDWTTQLHDILPMFSREDAYMNITVSDLLSHRTGLPPYDSLWVLSDNYVSLGLSDALDILNHVPGAAPLRTEWLYNNIAYSALGQVIETVSGTDYATFLQEKILNPLNMSRTYYTQFSPKINNTAQPYVSLRNATPYEVPQPMIGPDVIVGPAGGIRSTVHDMLIFYHALMDAGRSQIENQSPLVQGNPLAQMETLWRGMISIPVPSLREFSYAAGWIRAQLPAPTAFDGGPGTSPMLGAGLPSRLGLFHGGSSPGFTSYAAVFPETSSAVIVLSNSLALVETVRLAGQLLVEVLFNNTIDATEYIDHTKLASEQSAEFLAKIQNELLRDKTVDKPTFPLSEYAGSYRNSMGNFYVEIRVRGSLGLELCFMGRAADCFDLESYQPGKFFWLTSHDKMAQRARYWVYPKSYYIIEFGLADDGTRQISHLRWKHDDSTLGDGEVFWKTKEREGLVVQLRSLLEFWLFYDSQGVSA